MIEGLYSTTVKTEESIFHNMKVLIDIGQRQIQFSNCDEMRFILDHKLFKWEDYSNIL